MNKSKLDPKIQETLKHGGLIDMTTKGRQSGKPRRIEIAFHDIDGKTYVSGMPGFPRGWLANLQADPHFTFHLKGPVNADLAATARIITDEAERRKLLVPIAKTWKRKDLDAMVETSPLIEVTFEGVPAGAKS